MSGTTPDPVGADASNEGACNSNGGDCHDRDGIPCKIPRLGQEDRQSDTVNPPRYEDRQSDTVNLPRYEDRQSDTVNPLRHEDRQSDTVNLPRYEDRQSDTVNPPRYEDRQTDTVNLPRYEDRQSDTVNLPRYEDRQTDTVNPPRYEDRQSYTVNPPRYEDRQSDTVNPRRYEDRQTDTPTTFGQEGTQTESVTPSTDSTQTVARSADDLQLSTTVDSSVEESLLKLAEGLSGAAIGNLVIGPQTIVVKTELSEKASSKQPPSISSKLQNRINITKELMIQKLNADLYVATRSLEACKKTLNDNGCVVITGGSGDGKTTIGLKLLFQSNRNFVVLKNPKHWEEIDISSNCLIFIDDVFGRFVLDSHFKRKWLAQFEEMYTCVQGGKLQVIITCRASIIEGYAKQKFFEIREKHWLLKDVSVLGWATQESEKSFIEKLMPLMNAEISASTMTQELSKALVIACGNSKPDIYKLLVSIHSNQVSADCFVMAVRSSNLEIVNDLLRRKSWDIKEVSEALCQACIRCEYGIYKSLVSHLKGVVVPAECLLAAVRSENKVIVEELLKNQKWDDEDILDAMHEACTFDYYFILEYILDETGMEVELECMCSAIKKNHAQLVGRLLDLKKWTGEDISRAFRECCLIGNHDIYDLLYKRYGLRQVGSDCLCLSVSGGSIAIVKSLLDTVVWTVAEKSRALCEAYHSGHMEIIELLIRYLDAAVLPMDLLLAVARIENREMFETVQRKVRWDESEFSEALFELCCGKYDIAKLKTLFSQFPLTPIDVLGIARSGNRDMLLWALDLTCQWEADDISQVLYSFGRYSDKDIEYITNCLGLTTTECLMAAVRGGNTESVQKILIQNSWDEQLIVEALTNACRGGNYNIFTVLKLHANSNLELKLDCLIMAVRSGNKEIVKDLLTMKSWTVDDLTRALCESFKTGDLAMFDLLVLVEEVTVTWDCLCLAVESKHIKLVELIHMEVRKMDRCRALCEKTAVWSDAVMFRELLSAYNSAHLDVSTGKQVLYYELEYMMHRAKSIDKSKFSEALFELCCGKYDITKLKKLFSQFPLTPIDVLGVARSGNTNMLLCALDLTCQWEAVEISEELYNCGKYSDKDIEYITNCLGLTTTECLMAAVRGGNTESVQKILIQNSWDEQLIVEALTNACRGGNYNIFTVLKLHANSNLELKLDCLIMAVRSGNKEIVKDLLTMKSWTVDDLTRALCESCKSGDLAMFDLLVEKVSVTWDCLCTAVRSGSTEIVRELLKKKQWDNTEIIVARCKALNYNYPKTAELLKVNTQA
ncbi:hypothetical protein ScPMuIL_000687 [Solemya velum]